MRSIQKSRLLVYLSVSFCVAISASSVSAYCNKSGSYINSDGHVVKDPRCADDSAGARYICRDGSYSFSEHRQGACSRHGGIDKVL